MGTISPDFLSNLRAVGRSSLREMYTIMPAMAPNETPYTRGPRTSLRISQPSRAPGGEGEGSEGEKEKGGEREKQWGGEEGREGGRGRAGEDGVLSGSIIIIHMQSKTVHSTKTDGHLKGNTTYV